MSLLKNDLKVIDKELSKIIVLLKENQPTASLMTMKDKESLQSVSANEVKVSSTIMQPRHEGKKLLVLLPVPLLHNKFFIIDLKHFE